MPVHLQEFERMIIHKSNNHAKDFSILIAIVDNNLENIIEQYETNIGDLDPFELKRLLQNICERILSNYRRDLLFRYTLKQNFEHDPLREVL